jgi:hypothetical protein
LTICKAKARERKRRKKRVLFCGLLFSVVKCLIGQNNVKRAKEKKNNISYFLGLSQPSGFSVSTENSELLFPYAKQHTQQKIIKTHMKPRDSNTSRPRESRVIKEGERERRREREDERDKMRGRGIVADHSASLLMPSPSSTAEWERKRLLPYAKQQQPSLLCGGEIRSSFCLVDELGVIDYSS